MAQEIPATGKPARAAELTAEMIKTCTDKSVQQANEFLDAADKTAESLIKDAEAMVAAFKEQMERAKGNLRSGLKEVVKDLEAKGKELAAKADQFITHCSESSDRIREHHARMNGGGTGGGTQVGETLAWPRERELPKKETRHIAG